MRSTTSETDLKNEYNCERSTIWHCYETFSDHVRSCDWPLKTYLDCLSDLHCLTGQWPTFQRLENWCALFVRIIGWISIFDLWQCSLVLIKSEHGRVDIFIVYLSSYNHDSIQWWFRWLEANKQSMELLSPSPPPKPTQPNPPTPTHSVKLVLFLSGCKLV